MKLITNSSHTTNKSIVIASHTFDEAITGCITRNKESIGAAITLVTLHDLLYDYHIFDEFGDSVNIIRWQKNATECITNSNHLLLNRVLYIPDVLFSNFSDNDKEYAQREFEAYLGFSFNAFTGVGNKSPNGFCVNTTSLPLQWNKISTQLNLSVPNYYWGPHENNTLADSKRLVYSKIFSFLNWRRSTTPPDERSVFCFEKPEGDPVFILSIGNAHLITANILLSAGMEDTIRHLTKQINIMLDFFISELLFFINGTTVCFGCVNHEIIRSTSNPLFDSFVCANLMNEFYQCAN